MQQNQDQIMGAGGAPLGGGDNSANELTQLVQQMLT